MVNEYLERLVKNLDDLFPMGKYPAACGVKFVKSCLQDTPLLAAGFFIYILLKGHLLFP
jgi:hypothetical protein